MRWQDDAACIGIPTDAFFPPGRSDDKERREAVLLAMRVCCTCIVRRDCARWALNVNARHGIWAAVDLGDGNRSSTVKAARARLERICGQGAAA
ncbi:WhiB family transcriptional regulator [Nocardia brasiliensis]|uniref:WhiB family transcriptional regulator n=1 Tax=Nocardia brasiliensis TaxID=37326 RepID=UPI0033DE9293